MRQIMTPQPHHMTHSDLLVYKKAEVRGRLLSPLESTTSDSDQNFDYLSDCILRDWANSTLSVKVTKKLDSGL